MAIARLHGGPLDGQVLPLDDESQDSLILPYSETQIVYERAGAAENTGEGDGPTSATSTSSRRRTTSIPTSTAGTSDAGAGTRARDRADLRRPRRHPLPDLSGLPGVAVVEGPRGASSTPGTSTCRASPWDAPVTRCAAAPADRTRAGTSRAQDRRRRAARDALAARWSEGGAPAGE
jgi:hypothetical protein